MDLPNSQSQPQKSVQSPQDVKPISGVAPELPHLIVEEPKRGIFGTLGIVVLSVALLGIPLGIFLVSRPTQLAPQAAVVERQPDPGNGIFLESKLSSGNGIIPVDIYVKSPVDQINLVSAHLKFDPSQVSLEKIATGSAETNQQVLFNKWVEVSLDNSKGVASVIAGLPTPGLKTGGPNDEKVYLATVHVKPNQAGTAILQVTAESQILRNSDSENIFRTGNDLALNLSGAINSSAPTATPRAKQEEESLMLITSPAAATNYSYFKPVEIAWSSFNLETISQINLLVNGESLGPITQNLEAVEGRFRWLPNETLALAYVQPTNTYMIEIVGVSKNGQVVKTISAPFGLLGTQEINGAPPNPESFAQNQLNISDVSRSLSSYLAVPLKDNSLDLNKDSVVNELDLFLIRQNLLIRGIIK